MVCIDLIVCDDGVNWIIQWLIYFAIFIAHEMISKRTNLDYKEGKRGTQSDSSVCDAQDLFETTNVFFGIFNVLSFKRRRQHSIVFFFSLLLCIQINQILWGAHLQLVSIDPLNKEHNKAIILPIGSLPIVSVYCWTGNLCVCAHCLSVWLKIDTIITMKGQYE